jgi:hypothetical protein
MIISYSADLPENLSATIYRHFYHREEMETSGICLQLTIADISNISVLFKA